MSYNNVRSKLDRAIAAYLVSAGAGTVADTFPYSSTASKSYPNTTVWAQRAIPDPPMTGIRRVTVHVSIKGSAVNAPKEQNPEQARVAFDARVSAVYDALMQTEDGETFNATAEAITEAGRALAESDDATVAANNADMADFTCSGWYDAGEGGGEAKAPGCSWEEILIFEALCSPSNTD